MRRTWTSKFAACVYLCVLYSNSYERRSNQRSVSWSGSCALVTAGTEIISLQVNCVQAFFFSFFLPRRVSLRTPARTAQTQNPRPKSHHYQLASGCIFQHRAYHFLAAHWDGMKHASPLLLRYRIPKNLSCLFLQRWIVAKWLEPLRLQFSFLHNSLHFPKQCTAE